MYEDAAEMMERLTAVRAQFTAWEIDGLLVTSPANRRWLSGFTGSSGWLLVTADQAWLATDFRYWQQAEAQAPAFTLFRHQRTDEETRQLLNLAGASVIGLEGNHVTLTEAARFRQFDGVAWTELSDTLELLRQCKSAGELVRIRAAAAITDQAMAQVPRLARPGLTEQALAWALEKWLREAGAEAMAFDVTVASGPNAALPHHHAGERPLQPGDTLIVDMGAQVAGYKSDLTRTFFLGAEPDVPFWAVYGLVQAAQTAVFQHARPGQNGNQVDDIARATIRAGGHGDHFGHGLGHGVGLEIHERPFLTNVPAGQNYTLTAGMVVTVEPGIYIPNWGGVRLEELALVTPNGLELISQCPFTPAIDAGGWD